MVPMMPPVMVAPVPVVVDPNPVGRFHGGRGGADRHGRRYAWHGVGREGEACERDSQHQAGQGEFQGHGSAFQFC